MMNRCLLLLLWLAAAFLVSCQDVPVDPTPSPPLPEGARPQISHVSLDRPELPRYESLEMTLTLEAEYGNPYDSREVRLDGLFTGPDGRQMNVPGFWDGSEAWRIRFTPSLEGVWQYRLVIQDRRGESLPVEGRFTVTPSELHGWLQPGNWFDPAYSGRYLVHHDGTPFYGLGHCDALNILIDGFSPERGVGLFNNMLAANENYVVWWPLYSSSPVSQRYDDYTVSNLNLIDVVVQDAQKKGIFLIFTIWDHPQLRDGSHSWGDGRWESNGFKHLGSLESFFTSDEAWVWQENFYRYIIARWSYSPAIGMWQTVSEINGTNAYAHTDSWHERVNQYFQEHDPYRHPTTASMAGDIDWEAGHLAMDAPQVHLYDFANDAVGAAALLAEWTSLMWQRAEKPNWVGEFGVQGNTHYPELFHNAIWAAFANGAALTPAEWNSGGSWMRMTPEMNNSISQLAQFVAGMPLAAWHPSPLDINSQDPQVRGWGLAGKVEGFFWVQDFALEGQPIEQVRAGQTVRSGVILNIAGLAAGEYRITPYDTWQGMYHEPFTVFCDSSENCLIPLPTFTADMAFKLVKSAQ